MCAILNGSGNGRRDDIEECQIFGTVMLNRLKEISSHFIIFIISFL